jgi:integrase/recombinase XerD
MSFINYLQDKQLSVATLQKYGQYHECFTKWLLLEDITAVMFTYNDLLSFIQYLKGIHKSNPTIKMMVCVVRHYMDWLVSVGDRLDNPASGLFIKGRVRKVPQNLLSMEILEELFKQYSIQLNVDSSKKIILGMLIYQGLTVGELMRLESKHIQLKEGKLFIKGTKRSNERWLSLHVLQMMELHSYFTKNKFKEGYLLIEQKKAPVSEHNINNRIKHMFDQLRQLNPNIINAKQIRSSIITHWLRSNDLRQVQYMAGHKYVSSTERYQLNQLEDLQQSLAQHHPLR